jgi:hypothetical protein
VRISENTRLKTPNHTSISEQDDELIISTPAGKQTLSGEYVEISRLLISESDGETEFIDIVEQPNETNLAVAELLYEEGILYPVEQLEALTFTNPYRGLFETVLLSMAPERRDGFAEEIRSTTIEVRGNTKLIEHILNRIGDIGWDIDSGIKKTDPDIILFVETETTSQRIREQVNEDWIESDGVLLRIGLDSRSLEIGPILTPSSTACLKCLTTREEINDAKPEYDYTSLSKEIPYDSRLIVHFGVRLLVQVATAKLPAGLGGRIKTLNPATLGFSQTRLFGVPGCESCE